VANVDLGSSGHEGNLPVEKIEGNPDNRSPLSVFDGNLGFQGGGELPEKKPWDKNRVKGDCRGHGRGKAGPGRECGRAEACHLLSYIF